jgi:tetratricopeptide (TPR) repeat protein
MMRVFQQKQFLTPLKNRVIAFFFAYRRLLSLSLAALSLSLSLALSSSICFADELEAQIADYDTRGDANIDQSTLDKAESLFFKAFTFYQEKKYEQAAAYFQKAYTLIPHRDLLFNVARSREQMNDQEGAVEWYRAYLATKPIDETTIIHRLKLLGGKTTAKMLPQDQKKIAKKRVEGPTSVIPWVTIGAGVILAGVGVWSGMSALDYAEDARDAKIISRYTTNKDEAESAALIADVSLGLGAIAIATGFYLWYRADQQRGTTLSTSTGVSVSLSPDHVQMGYQLTF